MFSRIVRKIGRFILPVVLLTALVLPAVPMQAQTGLTVKFERIRESPVDVVFRVTLTNPNPLPERGLTMTTLLEGLSLPITSLNQIKVEKVKKESYIYQVPVYGWKTSDNGTLIWDIISYTPETRYKEVKDNFKNWSFQGQNPNTAASITLPGYDADRDGWGGGILVLDFTIKTGTTRHPDTGGYGSKGILALNIDGKIYKDLTSSSWWNASWLYRNVLSFNATALTENLTYFPVTIFLTPARFDFAKIKADGADLRFVDKNDTTSLPYHITQWSDTPGSENGTVVVQVPQIDLGSNYSDYIYIYYGNAGAGDAQNKNAVWANTGAVGVWPLYPVSQNGTSVYDSTSNNNTGNVTGATWGLQGRWFDGADDKIVNSAISFTDTDPWTFSIWLNWDKVELSHLRLAGYAWNDRSISLRASSIDRVSFVDNAGTHRYWGAISSNIWIHLTLVANGSGGLNLLINGVPQAPFSAVSTAFIYRVVGVVVADTFQYRGYVGEIQLYNRAQSAQEIKYTKLSEQYFYTGVDGGFVYYGNEDPPPTVTTLPATNVYMNGGTHATLRGTLDSLGGAPSVDIWFEWGYDTNYGNTVGSQTVAATGTYTYSLSNYHPERTVHYRFVGKNVDGTTYGSDQSFKVTPTNVYNTANTLVLAFALAAVVALFIILYMVTQGAAALPLLIIAAIAAIVAIIGITVFISLVQGLW